MDFTDLQKIWNEQNGATMYAINETAMHKNIKMKKKAASKSINRIEISLTIINSFCAVFLFADALNDAQYWDFVGSAILASTVIFIQYYRYKRKQAENTFDRTMIGELDHAISNTSSMIRITHLMIIGYLFPISILYISKMIFVGASLEKWLLIAGMFVLAFILVYFDRKKMHEPRIRKLRQLRDQLTQ